MTDRDAVREGVGALAHRWLGPGLDIRRASHGSSTLVYRVTRGNETFWMRLAEEAGEDRSPEWEVHRRLVAAGARVPVVIEAEVSPPELDRSACLTSAISGVPLPGCRDPEVVRRVAMAAGRDLAIVSDIDMRGYGFAQHLDPATREIVAMYTTRAAWIDDIDRAVAKVIEQGLLPDRLMPLLDEALAPCRADRHETRSHAAHGDLDATHIYYDPEAGTYTGIIDFGELMGADREWDLGHALVHDGEGGLSPIVDALIAGWGAVNRDCVYRCAVVVGLRRLARHHATPYGAMLAARLDAVLTAETTSDQRDTV